MVWGLFRCILRKLCGQRNHLPARHIYPHPADSIQIHNEGRKRIPHSDIYISVRSYPFDALTQRPLAPAQVLGAQVIIKQTLLLFSPPPYRQYAIQDTSYTRVYVQNSYRGIVEVSEHCVKPPAIHVPARGSCFDNDTQNTMRSQNHRVYSCMDCRTVLGPKENGLRQGFFASQKKVQALHDNAIKIAT
jgi:hypothetical protein